MAEFTMPRPILLPILMLSLCLSGPLTAQEHEAADEASPPRWILVNQGLHGPVESLTFSDGTVVDLGDPRLGRWAVRQARQLDRLSDSDLENWLVVCRLYRIPECERPLRQLAPRLARIRMRSDEIRGTRTAAGVATFRSRVFAALAINATDAARRDLERLMHFESRIEYSQGVFEGVPDLFAKAYCAAGLVMLDDDAGRDYLIEGYREYLLRIDESPKPRAECRNVMEGMHDAVLIERIEGLLDDEAITETGAQNNINTLLVTMRVNGLSLEELREIAATPADRHHDRRRRGDAIRALGMVGEPEDIHLLENLVPDNERRANYYDSFIAHAIQRIECLYWQDRLDD